MSNNNPDEFRLPRPSWRVPIGAMLLAGVMFGGLALQMSDVGHAAGCAIASALFLVAAGFLYWQSKKVSLPTKPVR